jgi:two-component system sensor histidine kinase DegS
MNGKSVAAGQAASMKMDGVIEYVNQEYQQVQKELKELEMLLKQSTTEVEKLAHRNAQMTNSVRNLEANLDTVPRDDIKTTYKAAQEVQVRLFMMRGQVEKLNDKQDNLKRYMDTLRKVIDISGGLSAVASEKPTDTPSQTPESIGVVKVINAQESERRSLANQLHDGPAQALTNLILQAEISERLFDSDPVRTRVELTTLKDSVSQTFQKVREFIFELRPMMLDDLGLTPTLKKSFEDYEQKYNIACHFRVTGQDIRMPPHAEVTVFRIVQQLLKNAQQHAKATQVQISLDVSPNKASVIVEDDGSGFNVSEALGASRQRKTIGLSTMQERVEMLGGQINIHSGVGQGTRVEFWIPTN